MNINKPADFLRKYLKTDNSLASIQSKSTAHEIPVMRLVIGKDNDFSISDVYPPKKTINSFSVDFKRIKLKK